MQSQQTTIQAFFDESTNTVSYLVSDPVTRQAAVIDPVLDYDHATGKVSTASADAILKVAGQSDVNIVWTLETHAHADHLSAAIHIQQATGAKIGIGHHICDVQAIFSRVFNLSDKDVSGTGTEFDRLFHDGDSFPVGNLNVHVLHTPGHTPACVSYQIGDAVFIGDTLFMPDYGTARADFPGGDARVLYRSIRRLLTLPPQTRLFLCHDYKAPGRDQYAWETTVAEQRAHNIHVHDGISEDEFVELRTKRDKDLAAPTLLLPSIQVNIRAGQFPDKESNGVSYLKIPLKL